MNPGPYVARSPEDLIVLVPFVLGFHPSESVVLLTFGGPHGSFHARVDLPDGPDDRAQVCEILCNAVRRNRPPTTAVIVRRSSVVLPEPDGPRNAKNCPRSTSSEMSSSTGVAP